MDTTVYSNPPHPEGPHVFPDSKWKVDEQTGVLHVHRPLTSETHEQGRTSAQVAAFGAGSWSLAVATPSDPAR